MSEHWYLANEPSLICSNRNALTQFGWAQYLRPGTYVAMGERLPLHNSLAAGRKSAAGEQSVLGMESLFDCYSEQMPFALPAPLVQPSGGKVQQPDRVVNGLKINQKV